QVTDQMPVEPDHVYVIPPGSDMSLLHGVLHLFEPTEARGLRQPIDFFFKSLADDRQHNSIGIILSGMGADGTLGLRAIRQAGGAAFAQTPASAQFDSMPRSAIDADVVDAVAPADELPAKMVAFVKREVLPALRANYPDGATLRAWIPGCSSGEEACSLAMLFRESHDAIGTAQRYKLLIFASDLDKDAISRARAGIYPPNIAADVSEARLKRFFVPEGAGYRVSNDIREMVIFAEQNVIFDPPFTKIDFLSCRNLLIYLEPAVGKPNLSLFAMAREGIKKALSEAFYLSVPKNKPATLKRVRIDAARPAQYVDIVVHPLSEPLALNGMVLVVFRDVAAAHPPKRHAPADGLVSDGQRFDAVLQTINTELQLKVAEVSPASNDMRNLLDNTEIAILFLDDTLHVRRFTPSTSKVFKLIPGDAGRSITDIVCDLNYPSLGPDALEVLRTLVFKESDVAATGGGAGSRCASCRTARRTTASTAWSSPLLTSVPASGLRPTCVRRKPACRP
ncbi:MAG: PAS domain-containing protein, partial [Rhodoferax sp.]|nr:PAS domain-containing protein [Rhodoferax sp.]